MKEAPQPTDPSEDSIDSTKQRAKQKKLYLNATKLFSSTTVAALLGVISFVIVARTLGAAGYGALALVLSFTAAILRFCEFQAWQALINYAANYQAQDKIAEIHALFRLGFLLDLATCFLAFVVAFFIIETVASIFAWQPAVLAAAKIYIYVLLVSIKGTPTAIFRFYDRFSFMAMHQIVSALVKLAAILVVLSSAPTFQNFVYAWMFSHIAEYLILLSLAGRVYLQEVRKVQHASDQVPPAGKVSLLRVASIDLLRFLFTSNLDSTLRMVRELDVQFVALFVDESAAGVLRVARQLATFAGRLLDAFYTAIYPDLAEFAAQRQWQAMRAFVTRTSLQVGLLGIVGFAVFAFSGEQLLLWGLGAEFTAAYSVSLVLLLAMVVWAFVQPLAPAVLAVGKPGSLLIAHGIAAAGYLIMLVLLVPWMGIVGAGWSLVGLYVVWGGLVFRSYQKAIP